MCKGSGCRGLVCGKENNCFSKRGCELATFGGKGPPPIAICNRRGSDGNRRIQFLPNVEDWTLCYVFECYRGDTLVPHNIQSSYNSIALVRYKSYLYCAIAEAVAVPPQYLNSANCR